MCVQISAPILPSSPTQFNDVIKTCLFYHRTLNRTFLSYFVKDFDEIYQLLGCQSPTEETIMNYFTKVLLLIVLVSFKIGTIKSVFTNGQSRKDPYSPPPTEEVAAVQR